MTDQVVGSLHRSLALIVSLVVVAAGCQVSAPATEVETTFDSCSDGVDNDHDLLADCQDPDCFPFCGGPEEGEGDAGPDPCDLDGSIDDAAVDAAPEDDVDADLSGTEEPDADVEAEPSEPVLCDEGYSCIEAALRCYDFYLDGAPVCAPRGASCLRSSDCEADVSCGLVPGWSEGGRYCLATDDGCAADGSCPDGFRCEAGACVDRRRVCVNNLDCPSWGRCTSLRSGLRVCLPRGGPTRCADDESCGSATCVDVDGDGRRECQESLGSTCEVNEDCADGVCGNADGSPGAECGAVGPCLVTADCPADHVCTDVDGDGALECQRSGGACISDGDCAAGTLCFAADGAPGAECW